MNNKYNRLPLGLQVSTFIIIVIWIIVALFPLLWMLVMSFKLPVDGFHPNPFVVLQGPETLAQVGGASLLDITMIIALAFVLLQTFANREDWLGRLGSSEAKRKPLVIVGFFVALLLTAVLGFLIVIPLLSQIFSTILSNIPLLKTLAQPIIGLTTQHYQSIWIENAFYKQFGNTLFVTIGVVSISLSIGTLAAYGLARTRTTWVFWILIMALIFRALPHSTLVTGYLPPFIEWGLYGKRIAVIIVLVAINQPFTIWMLRSFFMNIPAALDEAALVDGCNRLQAFWYVIMPIMWPGVITTGLFSFLLAYNDYLVSALLLDGETRTMVPAILAYFNRETTLTDQLEAIAAAASITFPLFLLVLFFQKQIVSGLTQGAVKG